MQQTLETAAEKNASDIHFEPSEKQFRIRLRVDGLLHSLQTMQHDFQNGISTRLKVLANLDIAENRMPQDGRFNFTDAHNTMHNCRLSTCPTQFGEKLVVRILEQHRRELDICKLGLDAPQIKQLKEILQKPQGLILVTGPTGSGKTLTLYTLLSMLNQTEKNIMTIEDPIEMQLPGINQVNVNRAASLDFATALRTFLRQDPDIIMLGEIRDHETAAIAIRAAQTGHLVFATLHTNSAAETIARLRNMGIEPYNLTSAVTLIIAQRLVRRLCNHCHAKPDDTNDCYHCHRGYRGRTGIFELLSIEKNIKTLILQNAASEKIEAQAKINGMKLLWENGLDKIQNSITTMDELNRVAKTFE